MRDGMGGAAFASKKLSDEKAEDKLSIQIANPFMGKKLIEACLEIFFKRIGRLLSGLRSRRNTFFHKRSSIQK